jgi:putative transcriptional regulator
MRREILSLAHDMHKSGTLDTETYSKITMRQIEKTPTNPISAEEIRALRERARMSQAVFASHLNLSTGYIAALERGAKHPSGPALVLLDVIRRKGLEAIL